MGNFNQEALEKADFSVKLVSFKEFGNDKFAAVLATDNGGKVDVVSVHATEESAHHAMKAYAAGGFEDVHNRLNPVGQDFANLLDVNPED